MQQIAPTELVANIPYLSYRKTFRNPPSQVQRLVNSYSKRRQIFQDAKEGLEEDIPYLKELPYLWRMGHPGQRLTTVIKSRRVGRARMLPWTDRRTDSHIQRRRCRVRHSLPAGCRRYRVQRASSLPPHNCHLTSMSHRRC